MRRISWQQHPDAPSLDLARRPFWSAAMPAVRPKTWREALKYSELWMTEPAAPLHHHPRRFTPAALIGGANGQIPGRWPLRRAGRQSDNGPAIVSPQATWCPWAEAFGADGPASQLSTPNAPLHCSPIRIPRIPHTSVAATPTQKQWCDVRGAIPLISLSWRPQLHSKEKHKPHSGERRSHAERPTSEEYRQVTMQNPAGHALSLATQWPRQPMFNCNIIRIFG
jgi:hypothetical protein